ELSPPQEQPSYRAGRATSRVQAGQVAEAVAEGAELTTIRSWPAAAWDDFACLCALASGKSPGREKGCPHPAQGLLRQAGKAGYTDAAHLKKDTDLDSLREREDFQKLLQELEKKSAARPERKP